MIDAILAACLILAAQPPSQYEAELWREINDYRQEQARPALQYSPALSKWARQWVCTYPQVVEQRVGAGNSVYRYRGAQHAPINFYPPRVADENAWMYAPTLRAVLDGWRGVNGWINSASHNTVLLTDEPCAGLAVQYGQFDTPTIEPPRTGPIAAVFLTGECG